MPHQVVILKTLHRVEYRTYGVEYATERNQQDERHRCVAQEDGEEEYYRPTHHQIDAQTQCWYRLTTQRLIEYAKDYGHPLHHKNHYTLPAAYDIQRYGRI